MTSLALLATVGGAALAFAYGRTVRATDAGPLGLIEALPPGYLIGVGMVIAAFLLSLGRRELVKPLLVLQLTTIVLLLYGLASYTQDLARLPTTWVHAGFIEYIQRTGDVIHGGDARFVWPAFFAAGALLNHLAGTTDQFAFLQWAPLALSMGYGIPVWIIARSTGAPVRACWLATFIFYMFNWVGQDYYSPQGVNFLLATSFLAVMLRVFFTRQGVVPHWANRWIEPRVSQRLPRITERVRRFNLRPNDTPPLHATGAQKAGIVGALVLLYGASVVSHQLTPFFLVVITVGLVLLDRAEVRTLPIVMIVGLFVWISFGATAYWQGNLDNLFGDVGNVGGVVGANVNSRVQGNPDHLPVIYIRLVATAGLWLLALVGLFRRMRQGRLDIISLVGFVAPFAVLGGQAYGGEAMLRVFLFSLPFTATLAASAFAPAIGAWKLRTTAIVLTAGLAMLPLFFVIRYGNEAFEAFTNDERELVEQLYEVAPKDSRLLAFSSLMPWRSERIEDYNTEALFDEDIPEDYQAAVVKAMQGDASSESIPSYLIVTRAQTRYAELMQGQPPGWVQSIVDDLLRSGDFRVLYENSQGMIIVRTGQQ